MDHPYYDNGAIKRKIESWLERRTLKTAAGFVTVTSTWLDWLRAKHPQPAQLAMNGFDPDDYPPEELPPLDPDKLTIIYAGGLYHGKRDPSPLFEALHLMGAKADQVRLIFHVAEPQMVTALAKQHGVSNHVEVHGVISRGEIIRKQCAADVLLLLRWDDPGEDSVLAGKLFEYIGARRHILSVGREHGEAADLIRDHDLGVVSKDPKVIAETLKFWLAAKNNGRLPSPENSADQLSRSSQFTELERFLGWVVQAHTDSPTTDSEHIRAR